MNIANGIQDTAIGVLNLPAAATNGIAWVEEKVGILDPEASIRVPYIPSPDWSRGLIIEEYGEPGSWSDTHGWSKFAGAAGVELLVGAKGASNVAKQVDELVPTANPLDEMPFTFRGDTRHPSQIFDEGFTARGTSEDLYLHALDNTDPPSAFIPTSKSFDIAHTYADNVYVVRPRNGLDVNDLLGPRSPYKEELEVAIPWFLDPKDIRGVTQPKKGFSTLNPNWVPE